jgi:PleD family two-component response regulator
VVAVAITRLAKHEESISLFVRHVKNYFAFYSLSRSLTGSTARDGNASDRGAPLDPEAVLGRSILEATEYRLATKISILIIDDDNASHSAIRQVLDSEGWQVRVVSEIGNALAELASGEWSLVIVNISMTSLSSPIFLTLKELALAPAIEADKFRARVLFLVPESAGPEVRPVLEKERLPYVLRPFQFNDFLEKVSDLLQETDALTAPIRHVRHDARAADRKRQESRAGHESAIRQGRRDTGMFAKRDEYVMTEEEIAEYEKTEKEEQEMRRKKKIPQDR